MRMRILVPWLASALVASGCVAAGDGAVAMRVAFAPSGFHTQAIPPETARIDVLVTVATGDTRRASLTPAQPSVVIAAPAGQAQVTAEARSAAGTLLATGQTSAQVVGGNKVSVTVLLSPAMPAPVQTPAPAPTANADDNGGANPPAGAPAAAPPAQTPAETPAVPAAAAPTSSGGNGGDGSGGAAPPPPAPPPPSVGSSGTIVPGVPYSGPVIWGP